MASTPQETSLSEVGVYYRRSDYAGFWRRFGTDVIDILVVFAIIILCSILIAFLLPDQLGTRSDPRLPLPIFFLLPAVPFAYFVLLKRSTFRTIGYRICGVRIVDLQGKRPTLFALTARLLFAVLGPLNFLLDLAWIPGDSNRQALRDKFAHTYVILATAEPEGRGTIAYTPYHFFGMSFLFPEVKTSHESTAL